MIDIIWKFDLLDSGFGEVVVVWSSGDGFGGFFKWYIVRCVGLFEVFDDDLCGGGFWCWSIEVVEEFVVVCGGFGVGDGNVFRCWVNGYVECFWV